VFLPSPLELTALGGMALVGAGLVFWFLKGFIKIAMILAIAGAVLLGAASIAYGYENLGKDSMRPQIAALESKIENDAARAESFRADAVAAQTKLDAAAKASAVQLAAVRKTLQGRIDALSAAVSGAVVGADAGRVLDDTIASVNRSTFGAGTDGPAAAASAAAVDATVKEWVDWSTGCAVAYGQVSSQLIGLQSYVKTLVAAGNRAVAATPVVSQ